MTNAPVDISIALLTKNGAALLERVLAAIAEQRTDRRYEVVAVDSGSTDGTLKLLNAHGASVIPIAPEDFDFGLTRDLAYQHARGQVVVNLSQDAVPAQKDWLENLVRPLDTDSALGASCGTSQPDPARDYPQFAWERNGYFYFTREIRKFVAAYGKGLSFSNSAVRRSVWESLRFDAQPLGEDFQLQKKMHAAGLAIAFPADAPVLHHHMYDFRGLWNRARNEGLALRVLGCPYTEWDLLRDLAAPGKYAQWTREARQGRLRTASEWLFPVMRPVAVYAGSRFARKAVW